MRVEERCKEVLGMLVEALGLDDIEEGTVKYDAPLFASQDETGEGLELDSVDALEIVVSLKSKYGIKLGDNNKEVLTSVLSIAEFVNNTIQILGETNDE